MGIGQYILDGHTPIPCADLITWAQWFATTERTTERTVGRTVLPDGTRISTVFIGIDHRFDDHGPPLLFETMIFGGAQDGYQERYATWDEAVEGHAIAVDIAHHPRLPSAVDPVGFE
jgi:hypothetical protein